ncbi:MAG TPA: hypothetical protein VLE93_01085 [Candidatus Saccharimonadales bacterium]|nr:hypothetical protein [Candidatus Saccharimonadales bacterium]
MQLENQVNNFVLGVKRVEKALVSRQNHPGSARSQRYLFVSLLRLRNVFMGRNPGPLKIRNTRSFVMALGIPWDNWTPEKASISMDDITRLTSFDVRLMTFAKFGKEGVFDILFSQIGAQWPSFCNDYGDLNEIARMTFLWRVREACNLPLISSDYEWLLERFNAINNLGPG